MTYEIGIYNHTTGEIIVREMTAEEQAERDAVIADWQERKNAEAKIKSDLAEQKAIAETKLAAIGLTADDLKALGLG